MFLMLAGGLLAALVLLFVAAGWRWDVRAHTLLTRMSRAPHRPGPARFQCASLAGLPAPVARYLRKVIPEGQPMVHRARLVQRGTFLLAAPSQWRPFRAIHTATVAPAGFMWDARIAMAPGLEVRVCDAFSDGEGQTRAALAGVVPLADAHGNGALAEAALMRWLAEAAWYPTALLPGQGVAWVALDDSTARATVHEGSATASLDFNFGADGLLARVYSPARGREVKGRSVPTPWQGRWLRYERRAGLCLPVQAEVEWLLPEGPQPYWRGELGEVAFELD